MTFSAVSTRKGAAILRFFAVNVFITTASLFLRANPVADAVIFLQGDTLESCRCTKQEFPCAALEKQLKKKSSPSSRTVDNFLDSLGYFSARRESLGAGRMRIVPGTRAVIVAESQQGAPAELGNLLGDQEFPRMYDAAFIAARTRAIARRLAESGYPFARIAVDITRQPGSPSMGYDSLAIVYRIEPDRHCVFAAPYLSGQFSTRRSILLRDVSIREGESFDIRRLEASRDALSRRSYIDHVELGAMVVEPEARHDRQNVTAPHGVEYVAVPFFLRDRTGLGMEGALGFNSSQGSGAVLQGDLTVSLLNVFHSGEEASLLYAGDKTYQKFRVETSLPWLFGRSLIGSASFGLEIHENAFGYLQGMARIATELSDRWIAGAGVNMSETTVDSLRQSWRYTGVDLSLSRTRRAARRGTFESDIAIRTGSGIALRDRNYTRSHVDFTTGVHVPVLERQAVQLRFSTMHLISDERILVGAEQFRVGGYRTVRGYLENEFAFRTVAWDQIEFHHYFSESGSVYIFSDNGVGFAASLPRTTWQERTVFLGYGLGVRVPARLGTLSVEWARNRSDTKSLGRIHVQITNKQVKNTEQP